MSQSSLHQSSMHQSSMQQLQQSILEMSPNFNRIEESQSIDIQVITTNVAEADLVEQERHEINENIEMFRSNDRKHCEASLLISSIAESREGSVGCLCFEDQSSIHLLDNKRG